MTVGPGATIGILGGGQLGREFGGLPFNFQIVPQTAFEADHEALAVRSAFVGMEECS